MIYILNIHFNTLFYKSEIYTDILKSGVFLKNQLAPIVSGVFWTLRQSGILNVFNSNT
jgi:hypothetical protein